MLVRVPLAIALGESATLSPAERRVVRASEFSWALHAAAIRRWRAESGEALVEEAMRSDDRLINEFDELAPMLVGMVDWHLRRVRPELAAPARQRVALRAAQVGICRLGLGETYAQIEARPEVDGRLRSLKAAFALLVEAYLEAWRRQELPSPLVPVALRGPRCV